MTEEIKKTIKATIVEMVSDLLYYDRKEDEGLGVGDIEKAIKAGFITSDEITQMFADIFSKGLCFD